MNDDEKRLLELAAAEGCAPASTLWQAVRIMARRTLDADRAHGPGMAAGNLNESFRRFMADMTYPPAYFWLVAEAENV